MSWLTEAEKASQVFFADIPYDIQLSQEKYYQSIFYLIFKRTSHSSAWPSAPKSTASRRGKSKQIETV
ncbi:MAG: hypothetical protein ACLFTI_08170 [Anaerolineales bacterium]